MLVTFSIKSLTFSKVTEMTDQEKLYKICILDLLIAIDDDIVDWRDYRKLWKAIQLADTTLDIWAGDNLKQMKAQLEKELIPND